MADLSIEFCGIKFKNPVLAASAEPTLDINLMRQVIEAGAGGLVAKSKPPTDTKPRGPRAWSDRVYAEIAAAYVARIAAGSRRPVADLVRQRNLSYGQIRDAIHKSRHTLGLLTESRHQGAAGGSLTDKAKKLLAKKGKVKK